MLESILLQGLYKIILALAGLMIARLGLFWMDRHIIQFKFKEWFSDPQTSDISRSIYYGSRIIAVAIVIGLAIS